MFGRSHRVRLVALLLVFGTSGCAAANAAWRAGPMGIAAEWTIRDHLMYGRAEQAWTAMGNKEVAPTDALLRHMYRGVIALHAGEFDAGAKSMDRAWQLVEQRYTKRISAGALSLVTSDAALPYYPLTTEHYFIPYYGALNWLALGDLDETAVEARRLAMLLQNDQARKPARELEGALRYVTGVLFEAAGEQQDAIVAYRNAAALLGALPGDTLASGADSGDVVVIVEEGFVGRPQPQTLGVYTNADELVALTTGPDADRLVIANRVAARRYETFDNSASLGWLTYEVNWATFGEPAPGPGGVRVMSEPATFQSMEAEVTSSVGEDFNRELPAKLARGIARAAVRYAAMRAAEGQIDKAINGDEDEDADERRSNRAWRMMSGLALGIFSVGSTVVDQPDLRAWQLLPHRLTIARLRLPAGEHPVLVEHGGQRVQLGIAQVRAGRVTVMTHRAWPGPGPRTVAAY